jgi:hypothetical protein
MTPAGQHHPKPDAPLHQMAFFQRRGRQLADVAGVVDTYDKASGGWRSTLRPIRLCRKRTDSRRLAEAPGRLPVTQYLARPVGVKKTEVVAGNDFMFSKIEDSLNTSVVIRYSRMAVRPGNRYETETATGRDANRRWARHREGKIPAAGLSGRTSPAVALHVD